MFHGQGLGDDSMQRSASATWTGPLREGKGQMSTQTGVLAETPYSFTTRFETEPGTNPEELVAAALSGCFSMALSGSLGRAGASPESIETEATLTMEKLDQGWTTTRIALETVAKVGGVSEEDFQRLVQETKAACPISRLLDTEITVTAKLA